MTDEREAFLALLGCFVSKNPDGGGVSVQPHSTTIKIEAYNTTISYLLRPLLPPAVRRCRWTPPIIMHGSELNRREQRSTTIVMAERKILISSREFAHPPPFSSNAARPHFWNPPLANTGRWCFSAFQTTKLVGGWVSSIC